MATRTQKRVLEAILVRGPWKRPRDLMGEALPQYPFEFEELTEMDANRTIDYGNEVLGKSKEVHYLKSIDLAPYLSEEGDTPEGRCVDMWQEEIPDEIDLDIFEKTATIAFACKNPEQSTINAFIDSADELVSEAKTYTYSYPTEMDGIEYDDTGQPMYATAAPIPAEPEVAPIEPAVVEARKRLRDRSEELRKTIKDKEALKKEMKKSKRAIGYETSKRIAEERKHRQKLKTFAKMYSVETGRIIFKKRT